MRALIVFDSLNDLVYLKGDVQFSWHLVEAGLKSELLGNEIHDGDTSNNQILRRALNRDIIMQLFLPLITSNRVMQGQFNNGYCSVECLDSTFIVITEHLGYCMIGVGKLPDDSEIFIKRRLQVFLEFIKLLYGPSLNVLKQETNNGSVRPYILSKLIDTWDFARATEQLFLIEAVEKLLVNETLSKAIMNLLQSSMVKIRNLSYTDEAPCHTLFLLKNKLLGLYSCRNASELSKEDLLLLVLLTKTLYQSAPSWDCAVDVPVGIVKDECGPKMNYELGIQTKTSSDQFLEQVAFGLEATESHGAIEEISSDFQQHLLFLRPKSGMLVPHHVYTIKISENLILVAVSQLRKTALCIGLNSTINLLSGLLSRPRENRCHHVSESLEKNMDRVIESAKKLNLSADKEKHLKSISHKWEQLKKINVLEFIKTSQNKALDSSLEMSVASLLEVLNEAFSALILQADALTQMIEDPQFVRTLGDIQVKSVRKLADYMQYLDVKADQNITITSYINEYPGLLHFMYVDRTTNCLLMSSFDNHPDITAELAGILKEKVWKVMEVIQQKLIEGCFEFSRREDTFHFSYRLFFEDLSGRHLEPKSKQSHQIRYSFPGVIGGDFYRSLIKKHFPHTSPDHVQCFEIFCVHLAAYSSALVKKQTWKLAMQLWESCASAEAAIDIL